MNRIISEFVLQFCSWLLLLKKALKAETRKKYIFNRDDELRGGKLHLKMLEDQENSNQKLLKVV